ncbi:COX15/CtaA family protein [Tundrisphaera lichenicola]|uniref:COX15/CtaA family protein n=1 Tax=Tundrisphaera lichenicola TaxID=2029860 RepID=UPI003EBA94B8
MMNQNPDPEFDEIRKSAYRPGPHRFALLATIFTWPLLFVGGLVTTYRVGMAVPDWPTTFGINMFLYDMTRASWAVFGEHTHRLYGAAVGVFVILLMIDLLAFDRRRWMKALGVIALIAVIGQGLLGGYRVRLNSTMLAAVHGTTAQVFFGLMVGLCVMTGRGWFGPARTVPIAGKLRRQSAAFVVLILGQVAIGAWLRHYPGLNPLSLHSIVAFLVLGHGASMVARILRRPADWPEIVPAARAIGGLLVLQIALGIGAWWLLRPYDGIARVVTLPAALIRTGHQANAGLLLASAVVLALRVFGQLAGEPGSRDPADSSVRDLEAVA